MVAIISKRITAIWAVPAALAALVVLAATIAPAPAHAQRLIATVNDAPITNVDLAQRIRLLRAQRRKASSAAAMESLVEDRLKAAEIKKYGIKPSDQQILAYIGQDAAKRKVPQQRLAYALQRTIHENHWKEHYRVQLAWDTLIRALYKSVSVSPREVEAELARAGKSANTTEYTLRQITLIVPARAGAAGFNARYREAQGLRNRFRDCQQGIALARALRDVAVKPPVTRRASNLNPQIVKLFDRTPVGRLTAPSRGATGVELIAVCGKRSLSGRGAAGQSIREQILSRKLEVHSNRRYQDLRRTAIVNRR